MINEENTNGVEHLIKEVGLYSRLISKRNTTHDNLVDMSIEKITLWKTDEKKRICEIILYIISLGIIFILELFFPQIIYKLRCLPAYIDDAEYVQILNKKGKSELIKLNKVNKGGKEIELENLDMNQDEETKNKNISNINNINEEEELEEYEGESIYPNINKKGNEYKQNIHEINYDIDYGRKRQLEENEKIDVETNRYLIQQRQLISDKYFLYLNNKYQYEENECLFVPCTFYLNRYTIDEIKKMITGIPNNNIVSKLSQKYGLNKINIKNQGIFKLILGEISTLSNIYILICIIIWIFMKFYLSILVVLIIDIILIIKSSKNKLDNIHSLSGEENKKAIVIREGKEIEIKSEHIVPGDIILLKKIENQDEIYIPCDGVILEGFCTVNESDLTGENTLVLKKEINWSHNQNEYFDYLKYKNSFLFQGTIIDSLYNSKNKEEEIKILATDIGFNTYRGNMLKNWEEQNFNFIGKKYNIIITIIFVIIILIINTLIYIFIFDKELPTEDDASTYEIIKTKIFNASFTFDDLPELSKSKKFLYLLNNITLIFPPTLLLCINFGRIFYNGRLKGRNISCVIEKKIDSTGHIDIIVLDKTGTLTESKLEMNSYKLSSLGDNHELVIGNEQLTSKIMNKIYKKFWQNIYRMKLKSQMNNKKLDLSYQTSLLYNIIYFTECLATCHNIFCFNQKIFGNSIDKELFQELGWEIFQENDDLRNPLIIQPHNSYKITENSIIENDNAEININNIDNDNDNNINIESNSDNEESEIKEENENHNVNNISFSEFFQKSIKKHLNKNNNSKKESRNRNNIDKNNTVNFNNIKKGNKKKLENNFYLKYLYRSEFSSRFQSMSVIVKNSIDNSIRLYVKGAPEKIQKECDKETIPIDIDKQLQNYTSKGFRVLACATKLLSSYNPEIDIREKIEKDMTFLGLIIFQNQLKKDTKINIERLESSGCKLIIATGDNVFTTISIAEQCGIIKDEDDLFRIETVNNNNTSLIIIHCSYQGRDLAKKLRKKRLKKEDIINNEKIYMDYEEENDDIIYSIKEEEYPYEFKMLIKEIVNNKNKKICLSGPALSIILDKIDKKYFLSLNSPDMEEYINNLEKLLKNNGKIFFRMLPDNKSNLISFLQNDKNTVVAMCGDGANDSNAFMQSDVGVAINQTIGNNLISHFYSTEPSISCLEIILKNGRACYENRINNLKFILISSILEISIIFILYIFHQHLNVSQYVFIDIILKLIPCILITCTKTNYNLSNKKPPKKQITLNFILSIIGLYIIQFGGALLFILLLKKLCIYEILDLLPIKDLTIKSSYVFLFLSIQNIFLLIIVNTTSINRLPFYTNHFFLIYISIIFFFTTRIITMNDANLGYSLFKFEYNGNEFRKNNELEKILILGINILIQVISFFYNMFINKFCDWSTDGILIKKK